MQLRTAGERRGCTRCDSRYCKYDLCVKRWSRLLAALTITGQGVVVFVKTTFKPSFIHETAFAQKYNRAAHYSRQT